MVLWSSSCRFFNLSHQNKVVTKKTPRRILQQGIHQKCLSGNKYCSSSHIILHHVSITLFLWYLFYYCFFFYQQRSQNFGPCWSYSPIGSFNEQMLANEEFTALKVNPSWMFFVNCVINGFNWLINISQRGSYIPQRESILENGEVCHQWGHLGNK